MRPPGFQHQVIGRPAIAPDKQQRAMVGRPVSARTAATVSPRLQPQPPPQRPATAAQQKMDAARRPPNGEEFIQYGAHGFWKSSPTPPPSAPAVFSPRGVGREAAVAAPRFSNVHALLREQVAQQQERAQQQFLQSYQTPHAFTQSGGGGGGDRWVEVLRPAIAWLFGFVDTQMAMTEGSASAEILDEHRRALDEVSRQVGSVLSSSPDSGLSASLWRATVSLLTHFAERAAPMMGQLRELQKDVAAARVLDAKHAVERASWERERAELRAAIASGGAPEGFRRGSIASRRRSSVSALRQQPAAAAAAAAGRHLVGAFWRRRVACRLCQGARPASPLRL